MRRPVRIERGLIPLIDVFALLIGTTIALLVQADFEKKKKGAAASDSIPQLIVSCRVDGRCLYQGEVVFEEHKLKQDGEARLLSRLAEDPSARVLLKIPSPEDASSLFLYSDLQFLQSRWGQSKLEVVF